MNNLKVTLVLQAQHAKHIDNRVSAGNIGKHS